MKFDKDALDKIKKEANSTIRKGIQKIDELATVAGEKLDKDAEWKEFRQEMELLGLTPNDLRNLVNRNED